MKAAAGDAGGRHLEVQRDPPAATQVDAPGGADERGELGEAAAWPPRVDRGELAAHFRGEAHSTVSGTTPSRASRRRLYAVPSEP